VVKLYLPASLLVLLAGTLQCTGSLVVPLRVFFVEETPVKKNCFTCFLNVCQLPGLEIK
jgi:hypothetical protein